jgi:hypothetical protein
VVHVAWAAAAANGKPITKYVVSYAGKSVDVTSGTQVDLTGLAAGQSVSVSVVAVNAAGQGAKAGPVLAKTIAKPTVTLGKVSVTSSAVTVPFTVDDGGGSASCSLAISGEGSASGNCSQITLGVHAAGVAYSYTVTVKNQAGSATASGSATTTPRSGVVHCAGTPTPTLNCSSGGGVGIYTQPWQDTSSQTNWSGLSGTGYPAYCKAVGTKGNQQASATLFASYFNNNKRSNMWVRISAPSAAPRYIPWVWFNLSPDDLSPLPTCS